MRKSEIIKQLNEAVAQIKELKEDDNEKWYTAYQYAQQQKVYADRVVAMYGVDKDATDIIKKLEPKIKRCWKYILPQENFFTQSYWFEAQRFADWWCSYFFIKANESSDPEFYDEFELFKRNAFLWDNVAFCKLKNGRWKTGRVVKLDLETNTCEICFDKITHGGFSISNGNVKFDDPKEKTQLFKLNEECVVARLWWDSIGFYVKAIPYLAVYLLFTRQLDKNMSFANLIPVININNPLQKGQVMNYLTDPDIFEFDEYDAPQLKNQQLQLLFDKIKWLIPEGIDKYYDALRLFIDKKWELLCNAFGRPIQNASGEQRLNADANTYASNSEFIARNLMDRMKITCKKLIAIGCPITIEENKMEKELEDNEPKDQEGNDNAVKDNPTTSEKKEGA